jgi:molecular chaperone DnaK (HSP70)
MPVLSEMASALSNIKSRVEPKIEFSKEHLKNLSLELIGGASRIPLIPKIVSEIFGIESSRTLNSSEAMSRGASIYGAIDTGFVTFPYEITL